MISRIIKYYYTYRLIDAFHVYGRSISGYILITWAIIFHLLGRRKICAKYLMTANRFGYSSITIKLFKRYKLLDQEILSNYVTNGITIEDAACRSIIIRWPKYIDKNITSKGILIITFTYIFSYYLKNINIKSLTKHFNVVLEPSWSGYFDPDILSWATRTSEPVFVEATEILDRITLNALTNNLIPLSFGSSDWVDYTSFHSKDITKQYDSLYVANTNPIKRVIRYMQAIKNICSKDPNYKGCLVCASWGGNEDIIRSLPNYFGIENNIELLFSLNKEELNKIINLSKVNILLSYKEGSNRSLFESMFVNIPVICIAENIGVNKSYINEHTGLLIPDCFLEDGLQYMKKNWFKYSPKNWALQNISPKKTTEKLLSAIKTRGKNLSTANPVYVKTNNPEVSYLNYQNIHFSDTNKILLEVFENKDNKYNLEYEIDAIIKCQNTLIRRINDCESQYSSNT